MGNEKEYGEKPDDLIDRNAYLLRLGITGIWFEKDQFEYVEGILRLSGSELRCRGVIPGVNRNKAKMT